MRQKFTATPYHVTLGSLIVTLGIVLLASRGAHAVPTGTEIDAAVDKAVAYLLAQQKADGSWEGAPRLDKPETTVPGVPSRYATYGGETAIVTYALLAAGQAPQSEPMKKAVAWLEHVDLHGTYATGLRAQVWNLLPDTDKAKPFVFARDRDRDYIYFGRIMKGVNAGFYSYIYGADTGGVLRPGMPPLEQTGLADSSSFDRSNSQYGVLGAWAVDQAGAEIPAKYWEDEDLAWRNAQHADGTWTYNNAPAPTMVYAVNAEGKMTLRPIKATDHVVDSIPTMTCAGVATLYITQDYVMNAKPHFFDTCTGGLANVNIERGLAWIDKNIDRIMDSTNSNYYYASYGVERIGVASGRKYIGKVDWFQKGAEALLLTQGVDGAWNSTLHDTSFSILFLTRGRAPVMMNKLIYGNVPKVQTEPWDERPRDVANLARWMGKRSIEGFLNWQLVDLKYPVEEFHDAPILYISGSEPLNLGSADIQKLRLFVQQGGMILGNADCGRKPFATSFKKLGNKLFPTYEFRLLPASHPIFSEQYQASKWKSRPQLEGLSNGVRELMVLIPEADAGRAWQNDSYKIRDELFQLGGNIFLYATGRENLHHKGDSYIVRGQGDAGTPLPIARLMVGDNPDPGTGRLAHLAAIMQNEQIIRLDLSPVKLGSGDLAKYKIAHLTGTTRLVLNDDQRKELKAFVDDGGTLIIDAAGGSSAFADAAETELKQIFGDAAAKGLATPLPKTHPVFNIDLAKIDEFHYRTFARRAIVGNQTDPRLRGIETDGGRIGVFYSREDLTAGLVGQPVDGIVGYDPHVAAQLMRNMILYAESPGK